MEPQLALPGSSEHWKYAFMLLLGRFQCDGCFDLQWRIADLLPEQINITFKCLKRLDLIIQNFILMIFCLQFFYFVKSLNSHINILFGKTWTVTSYNNTNLIAGVICGICIRTFIWTTINLFQNWLILKCLLFSILSRMGCRELCVLVLVCVVAVQSDHHHHSHKNKLKILHKMTPQNGCAGSQTPLCCNVKNNTCRVFGKRMNNANSSSCFCDSACGELGDCCLDYHNSCKGK